MNTAAQLRCGWAISVGFNWVKIWGTSSQVACLDENCTWKRKASCEHGWMTVLHTISHQETHWKSESVHLMTRQIPCHMARPVSASAPPKLTPAVLCAAHTVKMSGGDGMGSWFFFQFCYMICLPCASKHDKNVGFIPKHEVLGGNTRFPIFVFFSAHAILNSNSKSPG